MLVFLRHFACVGCAEEVTELAPRFAELERAGVRVVLVGNGNGPQLDGFIERFALGDKPVVVVTDPEQGAYRAAGFGRSFWGTYGPRALVDWGRSVAKGHRYTLRAEGDILQLGGVILVDGGGGVRLARASKRLGDHAPPSEIVDAALRLFVEAEAVHV